MNILIYGFGRMGLTHYAILNGLYPNLNFTIVEPNLFFNILFKKNIKAFFLYNDSKLNNPFDLVIISTPPFLHTNIINKCINRGDKTIFVEKPFGGHSNIDFPTTNNIFVGYVLRFNPCITWIKSNIMSDEIVSINCSYRSNTISKKPKGWRNGVYSGVLNEMGSHMIDIINYITSSNNMSVINTDIKSVISNVDDIVSTNLITENGIKVSLYLNWVDNNIRKPYFNFELLLKNGCSYIFDQQMINYFDKDHNLLKKINISSISPSVPFYLRGVDFTLQFIDLFTKKSICATSDNAISVNTLMYKILNHENIIRG
jgi:hypothetical protein